MSALEPILPARAGSHSRLRGRLFRKYLLLIIALVSVAMLTSVASANISGRRKPTLRWLTCSARRRSALPRG